MARDLGGRLPLHSRGEFCSVGARTIYKKRKQSHKLFIEAEFQGKRELGPKESQLNVC